MMNLGIIAQLLGYKLQAEFCNIDSTVSIDSRTIQPGEVYLALKGDHYDGHDFVAVAAERGAAVIICERKNEALTIPQWVVPSSLDALGLLATHHRQQITCPIIALTGSNGKTTVKEMIAAILPKPSLATQGNMNNHIGAPLSILKLKASDKYAVFELGANHPGDIRYTASMVKPNVAIINNIAPAHIEGFGSIEGVAKTKGEIYDCLCPNGVAIINDDDDYAHFWDEKLRDKNVKRFSVTKPVDAYAKDISWDSLGCAEFTLCLSSGQIPIHLKIPGQHSIRNALAAALATASVGIDLQQIAKGLNHFSGVKGRLSYLSGKNQAIIIDDTYNANLRSVLTAVEVLAACKGTRIFVLGDMGELGDYTKAHHEEVGRFALSRGIDKLFTWGQYSVLASEAFGASAKHYTSKDVLAQDLLSYLTANTTVLIKGSRSAGMEKVVHQLIG